MAATPIGSMPGHARLTIDKLVKVAAEAYDLGIPAVALFPYLPNDKKDAYRALAAKARAPRASTHEESRARDMPRG